MKRECIYTCTCLGKSVECVSAQYAQVRDSKRQDPYTSWGVNMSSLKTCMVNHYQIQGTNIIRRVHVLLSYRCFAFYMYFNQYIIFLTGLVSL